MIAEELVGNVPVSPTHETLTCLSGDAHSREDSIPRLDVNYSWQYTPSRTCT